MLKTPISAVSFLGAIFLFLLFACSADYYDDSPKKEGFTATVREQPAPDRYEVLLTWPSDLHPKEWHVFRQEEGATHPTQLVSLESAKTEFVDGLVDAGKKYRYELRAVFETSTKTAGESRVGIPQDFLVKESMRAPEVIKAARLYIPAGSKLVTMGSNFTIEVDQIISDGGVIETFIEGWQAAREKTGRSGGNIIVRAKRGTGNLFIYGRGEHGGKGNQGAAGAQGAKGKEGQYALSTHEKVDVLCSCGEKERQLLERVRNFDPFAIFQWQQERLIHRCITQTGDGAPGANGGPGGPGSPGGNGGDSSKIRVEIADSANIQVKAAAYPGKGAEGGEGGPGGAGGPGGNSGDRALDRFKVCRDASVGATGQRGFDGARGKSGQDGATFPMCVKLGDTVFGDCSG